MEEARRKYKDKKDKAIVEIIGAKRKHANHVEEKINNAATKNDKLLQMLVKEVSGITAQYKTNKSLKRYNWWR